MRHTFQITDEQAHAEWEALLGHKITGPKVVVMREKYLELAPQISAIQMGAAFRYKLRGAV